MWKAIKRWWKYLGAKTNKELDSRADPSVQLEQAIAEAQDQHRRLKEQAANVIAQQKQAEMRLNRTMEEYEHLTANARQAVIMADEANRTGDATKPLAHAVQTLRTGREVHNVHCHFARGCPRGDLRGTHCRGGRDDPEQLERFAVLIVVHGAHARCELHPNRVRVLVGSRHGRADFSGLLDQVDV